MTGLFVAVFAQGNGKIIAYIEELPETYAESATIEGARAAHITELALTLAANRHEMYQDCAGAQVVRRELLIARGRT